MALQNQCTGEEVRLGQRLLCEEHYGTIRYTGEVPPTQGRVRNVVQDLWVTSLFP